MHILYIGLGRINTKNNDGGAVRLRNILANTTKNHSVIATIILPSRDIESFSYIPRLRIIELKEPKIFDQSVLFHYIYRTFVACFFLAMHKDDYDIVYATSDFFHDTLPALAYKISHSSCKLMYCLFLVAPNVIWDHQRDSKSKNEGKTSFSGILFYVSQKIILSLLRYFASKVLVLNKTDSKFLEKKGYSKKQISVVNMGVNLSLIKSIKPQKTKYLAGYVGRIHRQKGIHLLIEAWKKVVTELPNAKLFLIGGGSDNDILEVKIFIHSLKLENNIKYLGFRTGKDVYRLLKSAKIHTVPSLYESWGQVVVEGLACGRPVITFDLPVFKEIFGRNVISVPIRNTRAYAKAILHIATQKDKFKNQTVVKKFINQFDWGVVSEKELGIYKQVLSKA